jgi:hypothetical protein
MDEGICFIDGGLQKFYISTPAQEQRNLIYIAKELIIVYT